jgi:hypothetical protein
MRHDVVYHVRRRHDPTLQAEPTQRFGFELMLAQPSPARGFVEVLPRNRVTMNRHDSLFHNAARFLDELLKQGAQVQLGSQFPVRQNGEGAIGFAIEVPADDFWRVAFRALLALRAAGSVALRRTGCAMVWGGD